MKDKECAEKALRPRQTKGRGCLSADQRLEVAIVNCDYTGIDEAVESGSEVTTEVVEFAIKTWGPTLLETLLSLAENPSSIASQCTAVAITEHRCDSLRELLELGADAHDAFLLSEAVSAGFLGGVQVLQDFGARLDPDLSPVEKAAEMGDTEMLFELLHMTREKSDAVEIAVLADTLPGAENVLDFLTDNYDALRIAAADARIEMLERLLLYGADIGKALEFAAAAGQMETLEWLHDSEYPVAGIRCSAVAHAAGAGELEALAWLLNHGITDGRGAICAAATSGHNCCVHYLIERGFDVNADLGRPLLCAQAGGHSSTVQLLLACGALPHLALTTVPLPCPKEGIAFEMLMAGLALCEAAAGCRTEFCGHWAVKAWLSEISSCLNTIEPDGNGEEDLRLLQLHRRLQRVANSFGVHHKPSPHVTAMML